MKDNIKEKTRKTKQTAASYMSEGYEEKPLRVEEKEEPKRKRVSFDLSEDLHRKLKVESATNGKKIYEMIEEALGEYLK